ncbi:MAG: flagellar basal body-associated FliL family protein [Gaiellaceae bacterium]
MSDKENEEAEGGKKSKKKLILAPVILLLVAGVGYKMFLAPKPVVPEKKIAGAVAALPDEFVVNLADGHYGKVSVALVMAPAEGGGGGGHGGGGEIVIEQAAAIRSIVTDHLTGIPKESLIERKKRKELLDHILEAIHHDTDEHVEGVLLTDITVQ